VTLRVRCLQHLPGRATQFGSVPYGGTEMVTITVPSCKIVAVIVMAALAIGVLTPARR